MVKSYRIGSAQINCTVGDLKGNCAKMMEYAEKAKASGVDIVVFPELAVTGCPPEDLLLKPKFIDDNLAALHDLSRSIKGIVAVIGFVNQEHGDLYNAACVVCDGAIKGIYHKTLLPNYGVFDEKRYFRSGNEPMVFKFGELIFGVSICEDIWFSEGPTAAQALAGATLILNINASPYHTGKIKIREEIVSSRATAHGITVSYTNLVGGQDELVFDGQSMIVDNTGRVIGRALAFKEDLLVVDIPQEMLAKRQTGGAMKDVPSGTRFITVAESILQPVKSPVIRREVGILEPVAEVYEALLLGLRDYVGKNGFGTVAIGLSGGIDSAIVAAIAVDALGKDRVTGVLMSSRYTTRESEEDAKELAKRLGITLLEVPIDTIYSTYLSTLESFFKGLSEDITEENIQARIRGNILMALSNKFGLLVLTTGNKSEMSVGYATLYGDMAGGFAVIKDVPKTLVYRLAAYRNLSGLVIPERTIAKEPTAELRPDQKDSDTLPPYNTLDPILKAYVEEDRHPDEIVSSSLGREVVERVSSMVDRSEYKRRQSPPGIKITPKAFGKDRRMPITNRYRG